MTVQRTRGAGRERVDGWELLAWGFELAEGPLPDFGGQDGAGLLVASTLGGGVHRLALDGSVGGELLRGRRGIGGLARAVDGGLLATGRDVVHVTADDSESRTVIASAAGITGYNDLTATPDEGLLVGALRYRPFAGERPTPGSLVLLRGGEMSSWDSATLTWPNGLGFSADGKTLYAADFATGIVHQAVWRDGEPAPLVPWVRTPSGQADGLSVDASGSVWVALGAGGGLARYTPEGALDYVLDVPANFVSSCCHAGPDLRILVATTADNAAHTERGGSVFITRVDVPGLQPLQAHV